MPVGLHVRAINGEGSFFLADERLTTLTVTLAFLPTLHARHANSRLRTDIQRYSGVDKGPAPKSSEQNKHMFKLH